MQQVKEETKQQPEIYESFVNILKYYKDKEITLENTNTLVTQLFANYPSLQERFKTFLPGAASSDEEEKRPPKPPIDKVALPELTDPLSTNEMQFFRRLRKVLDLNSWPRSDFYREFVAGFELYSECVITRLEFFGLVQPLFKVTEPLRFVENKPRVQSAFKGDSQLAEFVQAKLDLVFDKMKNIALSREATRRKHGWFFKTLSKSTKGIAKMYGNSYLDVQRPRIKQTRELGILNRQLVSVARGSEDLSFRHFRKNHFEDDLFSVEDEMYDMDLMIDSTRFLLNLFTDLYNSIQELPANQQADFKIPDDYLSPFRIKVIEKIYTNYTPNIVNMLANSTQKALQVVISRMQSKLQSWEETKVTEKERAWRETIEKNFIKSLDHRSFYFKQNEKKLLSAKNFIMEAKKRHVSRKLCREKLRVFSGTADSYDFLGGSGKKMFFNSFFGLSAEEIPHMLPVGYKDALIEDFRNWEKDTEIPYINAPEFATIPQFRLLMACKSSLIDATRLVLFALEKSTMSDKLRVQQSLFALFQTFMQTLWPDDILNNRVADYIHEGVPSYEVYELPMTFPISNTLRIALKESQSFEANLPLMKNNQVIYCPSSVYLFFRFFYALYERLLKARIIICDQYQEASEKSVDYGEYEFNEEKQQEYMEFLQLVCKTIVAPVEGSKAEELYRRIVDGEAFIFFTLNKLVDSTLKSLQALSVDEALKRALDLFIAFSSNQLNEEMYFYNAIELPGPIFRFHWDGVVMSITYIESGLEKIGSEGKAYARSYTDHLMTQSELYPPLWDDLRLLHQRLDDNYNRNNVTLENIEDRFSSCKLRTGLIESSYKLHFIPGEEDVSFHTGYYSKALQIENAEEGFLCKDKSSFVQFIIEKSQEKFLRYFNNSS